MKTLSELLISNYDIDLVSIEWLVTNSDRYTYVLQKRVLEYQLKLLGIKR